MKNKFLAIILAAITVFSLAFVTASAVDIQEPTTVVAPEETTKDSEPPVYTTSPTTVTKDTVEEFVSGSLGDSLMGTKDEVTSVMFSAQKILQMIVDTIENIKNAIVNLLSSITGGFGFADIITE